MSRTLIAMNESDTVSIAKLEMDVARIRHLPVVQKLERLVGIISYGDVLRALSRPETASLRVGDIMSHPVVTVSRHAPAHEAARLMIDKKIGALPVVEGERVIGMLTETDFVEVAERALRTGELPPRP